MEVEILVSCTSLEMDKVFEDNSSVRHVRHILEGDSFDVLLCQSWWVRMRISEEQLEGYEGIKTPEQVAKTIFDNWLTTAKWDLMTQNIELAKFTKTV